jgi:hypothetical protein
MSHIHTVYTLLPWNASHEEDEGITKLKALETLNGFYCDILTANGFEGSLMRMMAPTRNTYVAVMEPHSKERVQAIKDAKTAGQLFFATGGKHLNSDEFFQARALIEREMRTKELLAKKKSLAADLALEEKVTQILSMKGNPEEVNARDFTVSELKLLLK